ncbi:MAG: hypothetical protein ACO1SV_18410 [Fimbriimonas sp.]
MDSLTRWIQKQDDATGGVLRVAAAIAAALFLIAGSVAVGQTLLGDPAPPEAWVFVSVLLVGALALGIPALRRPRPKEDAVSLAPLQTAIWQGKLAETLGDHAEPLGQAATDLEQMEALLPRTGLDSDFATSLRETAQVRMRRMVDLTLAVPGRFGLTLEQAKAQFTEDGRWLHEVRRLVEKSHEGAIEKGDDGTLRHLESLVQAREEAIQELRA